ncbi:MAG: hypothetical protein BGO95_06615 [Micrococcales bacterium 73-13]|nr:MAG: hypothetical protein BGO95_06615 [Micrococcales bacterium 73-13]
MRRPGSARALRGLIAGLLTSFLALLFHVLGGGETPDPLALALCAAAVVWVAMLLGRRAPSLPLLVAAVAVGQVMLHTAFAVATGGAILVGDDHAGHGDGLLGVVGAHAGGAMWGAHLAAGALTILVIRRGERALRVVAATTGTAVRRLVRALPALAALAPVAPPRPVRTLLRPSPPAALRVVGIGSAVVRRGPPVLGV